MMATGGLMKMKNINLTTKEITLTGLGIALVFVMTLYMKIPNALDGYFNLGDGFIMVFASVLSPFSALLVEGVGSALADIAGGYAYYFFPTLCIKGLSAVVISLLIQRYGKKVRMPAYIIAAIIIVSGYFLAKAYLKQSFAIALLGVPGNTIQAVAGIIIAGLCYPVINRIMKK